MDLIRCPACRTFFRRQDIVVIDILNTIVHFKCFYGEYARNLFDIKDQGRFKEITEKHGFFQ